MSPVRNADWADRLRSGVSLEACRGPAGRLILGSRAFRATQSTEAKPPARPSDGGRPHHTRFLRELRRFRFLQQSLHASFLRHDPSLGHHLGPPRKGVRRVQQHYDHSRERRWRRRLKVASSRNEKKEIAAVAYDFFMMASTTNVGRVSYPPILRLRDTDRRVRNPPYRRYALAVSYTARRFSNGTSGSTVWTGARMYPPPWPRTAMRSRTSAATSAGVPKGSVSCVSTPP